MIRYNRVVNALALRKARPITELENCRLQINRMRALLDEATLDNVREKYQRSLRAWEARADTVERTITGRAGRA